MHFALAGPDDYSAINPGEVTLPLIPFPGQLICFTVCIIEDSVVEDPEVFTITMTTDFLPVGVILVNDSANVTIVDNEG